MALKLLRFDGTAGGGPHDGGSSAGREDEARFRTEAAAAASLRHPNIVPVYEAGTLPAADGSAGGPGRVYLAMELVSRAEPVRLLPPAPRCPRGRRPGFWRTWRTR